MSKVIAVPGINGALAAVNCGCEERAAKKQWQRWRTGVLRWSKMGLLSEQSLQRLLAKMPAKYV